MDVLSMFYDIFIFPIVFFLELIIRMLGPILEFSPILAIFIISLIVNLITHPIFARVEYLCKKDTDIYQKLLPKINSIKRNFTGNEQRMLLQTFFRQTNYHPFLAHLKQSLMIFLQVPVFIASYQVISQEKIFKSLSMESFNDFFLYEDFSIKILPIFMTLINLLSVSYYLKEKRKSKSNKIYATILPLVFLLLLYNAPASIVLYWIFNNYFSLLRNLFFFARKKIKYYIFPLVLIVTVLTALTKRYWYDYSPFYWNNIRFLFYFIFLYIGYKKWALFYPKKIFLYAILIFSFLFMLTQLWLFQETSILNNYVYSLILVVLGFVCYDTISEIKLSPKFFVTCICLMSLVCGLYLPIKLIVSDPNLFYSVVELSDLIFSEFLIGVGIFIFYPALIFGLLPRFRKGLSFISIIFTAITFYHLWTFKIENDTINPIMQLVTTTFDYTFLEKLLDLSIDCSIIIIVTILIKKSFLKYLNIIFIALLLIYSYTSLISINDLLSEQKNLSKSKEKLDIGLSKSSKNVLILFMDRAVSGFIPLIFEEKEYLKEEFSGFVYYPYTVSFATATLYSVPSLFGGYEYTPLKLQNDSSRMMVDKHNESISVLPELFRKNGYHVSLTNVTYPNYGDRTRPPIFHQDIHLNSTNPYAVMRNEILEKNIRKKMFFFNLLRLSPRISRKFIYSNGNYFGDNILKLYYNLSSQGEKAIFDTYIEQLRGIEENRQTFLVLNSNLPHEPTLLNKNYEYSTNIEDIDNKETYIHKNHSLTQLLDRMHYDVNMLSYMEISKLLHKMKQLGVYDQTRIIIVSDHGWRIDGLVDIHPDITRNNSVLMIKDFNAKGRMKINSTFMTTADLPFLATQDIIKGPINPFTKKSLSVLEKDKGVDIIDVLLKKWSPTHFKDKERAYLYEDDIFYRHIDKNTIKDFIKLPQKESKK